MNLTGARFATEAFVHAHQRFATMPAAGSGARRGKPAAPPEQEADAAAKQNQKDDGATHWGYFTA
jgi:ribosomal protein L12E/L44/L45/RPP1/RPP2